MDNGAYLATALGHCAECHTPRNLAFALDKSNDLAGSELQGWRAWNITVDPKAGVGAWSDAELASYLSTGHAEGRGSAGGPMGEAVEHSLQYLKPEDTAALVTYLRSVPARQGKSPVDIDSKAPWALASSAAAPGTSTVEGHEQGLKLFAAACVSCHQWNGHGQQTPYASIAGFAQRERPGGLERNRDDFAGRQHAGARHRCVHARVRQGVHEHGGGLAGQLRDGAIGNEDGKVTPEKVAKLRAR